MGQGRVRHGRVRHGEVRQGSKTPIPYSISCGLVGFGGVRSGMARYGLVWFGSVGHGEARLKNTELFFSFVRFGMVR